MASVASQLIEELTAHAQSDSLEDARGICADGTYFPNNLRITKHDRQNIKECKKRYVSASRKVLEVYIWTQKN